MELHYRFFGFTALRGLGVPPVWALACALSSEDFILA